MQFSPSFVTGPLLALLEYSGLIRGRHQYAEVDHQGSTASGLMHANNDIHHSLNHRAEVSIRIIGGGHNDHLELTSGSVVSIVRDTDAGAAGFSQASTSNMGMEDGRASGVDALNVEESRDSLLVGMRGNRGSASQRYDFQQLARWIKQVVPFTILLLMLFIRQHIQGFVVTFWISAVMVKANILLRKQTALKGERRIVVLVAVSALLLTHIVVVYCFYRGEDLLRPLLMVPPKEIPKFWQAIFIILVNDTMVRQMAMVVKCSILICCRNGRGRPHHRQARVLTVIEYTVLLYRALLPAPVWYRFFLNNEYGIVFSSLTTGLYLTFKLTATLEKVQRLVAAVKLLLRSEVQYGSSATCEEVSPNATLLRTVILCICYPSLVTFKVSIFWLD